MNKAASPKTRCRNSQQEWILNSSNPLKKEITSPMSRLHALNCFHSPLKEKRWVCPSTCCSPSPSSCCCSPIRSPKHRWGCPSSSATSCSPWSWWRSRSSSAWLSWTCTTAHPTHTRCRCGFARWGRHWFHYYSTHQSVVCSFVYFL